MRVAILFLCAPAWGTAFAQSPEWRTYTAAAGLAETAVSSVNAGQRGGIWTTHPNAEFISRFDGYEITTLPAPRHFTGRIHESRSGQIWSGFAGGVQEFRDGQWIQFPISKIGGEPVALHPFRHGRLLLLTSERLLEFNSEWPEEPLVVPIRSAAEMRLGSFLDMIPARDGGMWILAADGLAKIPGPLRNLDAEVQWTAHGWPGDHKRLHPRSVSEDEAGVISVVAGTGGATVLAVFEGARWKVHPLPRSDIRFAWRAEGDVFWCVARSGLFRSDTRNETLDPIQISTGECFDAAVDAGGRFWVATANGLFRHAPTLWRVPSAAGVNVSAHSMAEDRHGRIWTLSAEELIRWDESARHYPLPPAFRNNHARILLHALPDDSLLLGRGGEVLRFDAASEQFGEQRFDDRTRRVIAMPHHAGVVVQTQSDERHRLFLSDGVEHHLLADLPEMFEGELSVAHPDGEGGWWFGGANGAMLHRNGQWRAFNVAESNHPQAVSAILALRDGRIWCGGLDKIWEYDGQNWTVAQGGFGQVHAMVETRAGHIWVASDAGLYWFHHGAWIHHGAPEGVPDGAVMQVMEDRSGRVWSLTARGPRVFHPESDSEPPRTLIEFTGNRRGTATERMLTFGGRDKWDATAPDRLLHSFRLNEQDWSPWESGMRVSFSRLAPGTHYFQVRSMDRNGNIDASPALFDFAVVLPWHKEARSMVIALAGALIALFFAAVAVNRHRRLVRGYAEVEKLVALRTSQLERAHQELLQSQKMNALGTLAAGIAHDFNNILSIIKGSAQIIEGNLEKPDKVRTRVQRIKTVVDQGAGIVKAMLGFSRNPGSNPGGCEINPIVARTITLLGDRFLREVEVRFQPGRALPIAAVLPELMQQILLNLIFNAADAMGGRGRVVIRTGQTGSPDGTLALAPAAAGGYVFIAVEDFGCGIPNEIQLRIFEPFFTTKGFSARRGTGLGLSMVYELAREMKCGLQVRSTVGEGSTFVVLIPAQPAEAQAESDGGPPDQPSQGVAARIGEET